MVSNRGLAVIIIVAVVFSLSAQFISIFWLSQVSTAPVQGPTAYATGSGEVKLNITTSTDISVSNSTVNFGNGLVNSTICSFANLSNNGTGSNQPNSASNGVGCWVNDTSGPGKGDQQAVEVANTKIVVQNDGSRNVTLTMTSAQGNAANFVGNCSTEANGLYLFAAVSNESGDAVAL
ncbi:MAG: hypothetical protein KKG59_02520, partial [Nanoarchaeota archaeon]|nr:hypothetical protein [Nanoarchaeota archaeon]